MIRKPVFWLVFILLFIAGTIFSFNFFDKANPIVNLDIKMDRTLALKQAEEISEKYDLGPQGFKKAASFSLDSKVKNFVELEIGGADAFNEMISGDLYSPYTWKVRHFKPEETNEVTIFFTPTGDLYGFVEKIPEDQSGTNVSSHNAVGLIENFAHSLRLDLNQYSLVENSQEVLPGERVDHTLVYERNNEKLKDATYRLKFKLSGNRISEYKNFIKIPEAFTRKYDEMRSTNTTISAIASVAMAVLYIFGGCIFGLFVLLRQNWVLWKKALYWGIFIAFLQMLVQINNWPLMWMSYDTAIAAQGFLMQQIVQLLILFIAEFLLLTLTFMAAESLGRKAFPEHIQLWKTWSKDVANSKPVAGQTISGYLAVTILFVFDIGLYFFTTKVLGWWVPSSTLFDPNILATHMPWFDAIAQSLHAGFWEEALFRAIPIAGAALIGKKYGKRNLWIAMAFVIQSLIFGAGHANYPMQPSYARVIELIIPSIAFGLLYLKFGLLPGVILHYAYDVVWFSMPLFSTSGLLLDKLLIIILTFVPVIILIWRGFQVGKLSVVPEMCYNKSWKPVAIQKNEERESVQQTEPEPKHTSNRLKMSVVIAGIIAIIVWVFTANYNNQVTYIDVDRAEAENIALNELENRGISLNDSIVTLSVLQTSLDQDDRFIWQEYGEDTYKNLLGDYLHNPYWLVRFARFEGSVDERAEEYLLFIENGKIIRFNHKLPESAPGDSLKEDSARVLTHEFIRKQYGLDPAILKEITASPSKLPNRRDWNFEFSDTVNCKLSKGGDALIIVNLAGNEIVDSYKKIKVPEKWIREEKAKSNGVRIIKIICTIAYVLTFLTLIILAIISWSKGKFSVKVFLPILVLLILTSAASFLNSWPVLLSQMQTAIPLSNQKIIFGIGGFFSILMAFVPALIFGFMKYQKKEEGNPDNILTVLYGISIGFIIAAISTMMIKIFGPSLKPYWSNYSSVSDSMKLISNSLSGTKSLFMNTCTYLLAFWIFESITKKWKVRKALGIIFLLFFGLIVSGLSMETISYWLISGVLIGIIYIALYFLVVKENIFQLLFITLGITLLTLLKGILINPYQGSMLENMIAIITLVAISVLFYIKIRKIEV